MKDVFQSQPRSRFTIIAKILQSAQNSMGLSKLILEVRTNHVTIKEFLRICLKAGLLKKSYKNYKTTEKGMLFLSKYNVLEEVLRT